MIGLVVSFLAFASALLVARREPRHRPIASALAMSAAYALYASHVRFTAYPRLALALWTCVAIMSGLAYLKVWSWDPLHGILLAVTCLMLWGQTWLPDGEAPLVDRWTLATWGPFVASSIIGVVALWRFRVVTWGPIDGEPGPWIRTDRVFSVTQRIALILLVSDVCMLLFIPWPGVQMWQGRVSAIVVTLFQVGWLYQRSYQDRCALILSLLRGRETTTGLWLVEHSGGKLARGTVYVWLNRMEDDGLIESKRLASGKRIYRSVN